MKIVLLFLSFYPVFLYSIRIVSLTPAITSMLIDLGYSRDIVGVTSNDFFLNREVVGSIINVNHEKIINLKPDFIIYQDFQAMMLERLKKVLPEDFFIMIKLDNIYSIFYSAEFLVSKLGFKYSSVKGFKDLYEREINDCRKVIKDFKYLFIVDRDYEFKNIFVAGEYSFISEILNALGGKNIIDSKRDYIRLNQEVLFRLKDVIIFDSSLNKKFTNDANNILNFEKYFYIRDLKFTIPDLRLYEKVRYVCGILKSY